MVEANLSRAMNVAIDSIDAVIFCGDEFANPKRREVLREYMARWERGLAEFDRLDEVEDGRC